MGLEDETIEASVILSMSREFFPVYLVREIEGDLYVCDESEEREGGLFPKGNVYKFPYRLGNGVEIISKNPIIHK